MSSTDDKTKSTCPICGENALVEHCESITCLWLKCRNIECQASLDISLAIGHKRGDAGRRIRLVLTDDGEWRERIEG